MKTTNAKKILGPKKFAAAQKAWRAAQAARRASKPRDVYLQLLQKAAALGYPHALSWLSDWMLEGERTKSGKILLERSARGSLLLLLEALALSCDELFGPLGNVIDDGLGIPKSSRAAFHCYARGAIEGDASAAHNAALTARELGDEAGYRRWSKVKDKLERKTYPERFKKRAKVSSPRSPKRAKKNKP